MYGYIYKTTNDLDGKIYIGQKKSEKFLENKYLGSGKHLKNAINLYGKEHFHVELLCKCNTPEELNEKEIYYIAYFNARDKNIGYNILPGGQINTKDYVFTEEHRKKLSEAKMGHTVSEETKRKIGEANKGRGGRVRKNYHHSEETKRKIGESNKKAMTEEVREKHRVAQLGEKNSMYGRPAVNRRKCKCLTTGETFDSLQQAADYYNFNSYTYICNCCRKNEKLSPNEKFHKTKGLIFVYC